jgi:hypothetical protein
VAKGGQLMRPPRQLLRKAFSQQKKRPLVAASHCSVTGKLKGSEVFPLDLLVLPSRLSTLPSPSPIPIPATTNLLCNYFIMADSDLPNLCHDSNTTRDRVEP